MTRGLWPFLVFGGHILKLGSAAVCAIFGAHFFAVCLFRAFRRATSLVVGYLGILVGLFHKILFGGSVSRQKEAVKVRSLRVVQEA